MRKPLDWYETVKLKQRVKYIKKRLNSIPALTVAYRRGDFLPLRPGSPRELAIISKQPDKVIGIYTQDVEYKDLYDDLHDYILDNNPTLCHKYNKIGGYKGEWPLIRETSSQY